MPTQATRRRDPRNAGKGFSTHHGFTVIELMISLAVLAVITSLALPSYRTIMEKRQVTSGAEQLGAFLSSAQLESVKRNQFVAVKYDDGIWCLGMTAGDTAAEAVAKAGDCDCSVTVATDAGACLLDAAQMRLFNSSVLNYPDVLQSADVGGGDNIIVYDPVRGLTRGSEEVKLELQSVPEGNYALDVEVKVTGRVKICSKKDAGKDVPGYKECSA